MCTKNSWINEYRYNAKFIASIEEALAILPYFNSRSSSMNEVVARQSQLDKLTTDGVCKVYAKQNLLF